MKGDGGARAPLGVSGDRHRRAHPLVGAPAARFGVERGDQELEVEGRDGDLGGALGFHGEVREVRAQGGDHGDGLGGAPLGGLVEPGEGRARVASEAQIDPAGEMIVFDALGGLEIPSGTDRTLAIQRGGAMRVVSVNPETGFISLQIP